MDKIFLHIGPIKIYWYSITMLLAILTGIFLAIQESKKLKLNKYIEDLLMSLIIYGILGARIYYVIFNFDIYKNDILGIFRIWEGGLAIYGAVLAGLGVIIYNSKKSKKSIIETTDIIVPGLLLAQGIGRWGNFFNQEAHGRAVPLEFLQNMHLPNFIISGMNIDGIYYEPTFLYESIWCVLGFILLIIIRNKTKRTKGVMTASYFIWYGIGRMYIEGLRTDSLYLGNVRISQLVSLILILIGIAGIIKIIISKFKNRKKE